ncbi:RecX family transcriptional regulator [Slackia piriformis]|nr:RecX family transcriptional regulator [Slackia piriformis]
MTASADEKRALLASLRAHIKEIESASAPSTSEEGALGEMRAFDEEERLECQRHCAAKHREASSFQALGAKEDPKQSVKGALRKIERLCAVREQSSVLLTQRLVREGFDESCVSEAVSQALSWGLLDDMRYAECLVRTRLAAGRGISGIERELAKCGIALSELDGWPERFDVSEEGEVERALAVLRKSPPRSKNRREGAYRKLCTKGFSASVATTAARLWSESAGYTDL